MDRTESLGMPEPLHGSSGGTVASGRVGNEREGDARSRGRDGDGEGTIGRHRIENAQGSRLGDGGGGGPGSQSNSSDSGLSPNDEQAVNDMRSEAQALTQGEAKDGDSTSPSEADPRSNTDDAFVDANFPASESGSTAASVPTPTRGSARHGDACRVDRVAAEREAAADAPGAFGGLECSVCGRSPVLSCCAQCGGLDGAPLVLCAVPDEPGGLSCFEQYHQRAKEGP